MPVSSYLLVIGQYERPPVQFLGQRRDASL